MAVGVGCRQVAERKKDGERTEGAENQEVGSVS